MRDVPLLTPALLEELGDRWKKASAPIADNLRPGADPMEMRAGLEAIGLELPAEVEVWWSWHDGAHPSDGSTPSARMLGPGFELLSFAEAFAMYKSHRARWAGIDPEVGVDYWWPRSLFPLTYREGEVLVQCAGSRADYSAVFFAPTSGRHPEEDFRAPRARSLGELVTWWLEALDGGAWSFDSERAAWNYDWKRLPAGRERTGLV